MLNKQKAIDNIIENFNWEKVHETMVALNWRWWDSENAAPSIGALFRCATELLHDAYNRAEKEKCDCSSRTGGFHAWATVDDETKEIIELRLAFEICNWGYYD
jgi:hypothetical protein